MDLFGFSVAVDGLTAFVGAREENDLGTESGAASVFERPRFTTGIAGANRYETAVKVASYGVAAVLRTNKPSIFEVRFLGSTAAVSQTVRTAAMNILQK